MKRKFIIGAIIVVFALVLTGAAFWFGFNTGTNFPQVLLVRGVTGVEPEEPVDADFGVFWQAWQMINDNYVKADEVGGREKVYGAIAGMINSLNDPYTVFFSPEDGQKFDEDIKGNFGGVGAEIGIKRNQLTVVAPLKDTPAFKAGLKAGDRILAVNGTSTEGLSVNQSVQMIRGPIGTDVTLTILREGWDEPRDIVITRANIVAPTLDFEMKEGGVAYLALHSFNANVNDLFRNKIDEAFRSGMKGMILDLRDDPGGYLQVSVDLAGWFLERGSLVVSESSKLGPVNEFKAEGNGRLKDLPLVVLVNEGSASASEILAGALRDHLGVKLVGQKTYGKGTVQQIEYLKDGSSLKITVANWVLPSGRIIEGEGLVPDIEVELTEEDFDTGKDPQLEKAIEILRSEISSGS